MTNNQIKYMIEVAETGSVNQAARNLYISQSALSNAIMSVEQEFGRKIFNRSSRGMTLTPFGKLFIAYITPIHQQLTQLYAMRNPAAAGSLPRRSILSATAFTTSATLLRPSAGATPPRACASPCRKNTAAM